MKLEALLETQATHIPNLCKQLAEWATLASESSSLPLLELFVMGYPIVGRIVKYDELPHTKSIWVERSQNDVVAPAAVSIIDVAAIRGITFMNIDHYLNGLELYKPEIKVSMLEFGRTLKKTETSLKELFDKNIPLQTFAEQLSEEHRTSVYKVIDLLPTVLTEMMQDPLCKKLLVEAVESIKVSIATPRSTTLTDKTLGITIQSDSKFTKKQLSDLLKSEIEALL